MLPEHLAQAIVRHSLMQECLHGIIYVPVVWQYYGDFTCALGVETFCTGFLAIQTVGGRNYFYIVEVQFLGNLLQSLGHFPAPGSCVCCSHLVCKLILCIEVLDFLVSYCTLLSALRFSSCFLNHFINFSRSEQSIHTHCPRDNPRICFWIWIGTVTVRAVLRNSRKSCKGMLEFAVGIHSITHCFLLIVHIIGILDFCPHEICREQPFVTVFIHTIELQGIRDFSQMPPRTIGQLSAPTLCTFASGFHLVAPCLALSCYRCCISIKPYTDRCFRSTGIGNHRRIELAILQHEHLVSDTCLYRGIAFSNTVNGIVITHENIIIFVYSGNIVSNLDTGIHFRILGFFLLHFLFHQLRILLVLLASLFKFIAELERFSLS